MHPKEVVLIGLGAIGSAVFERMASHTGVRISHVVVSERQFEAAQQRVGARAQVVTQVPACATTVLECAGHGALAQHVLPALAQGKECAILSIGALADDGMCQRLEAAAKQGGTRVHLLAGAIGGIEAISAARLAGLDEVIYTGRKPPIGWKNTPAEALVNLDALQQPTTILEATAREAARFYPKNANVAATVAIAGLGLDQTRVRLIADPNVKENVHEVEVRGAFGEMRLTMRGKPLADNPKTSTLTVMSALRFLHTQAANIVI